MVLQMQQILPVSAAEKTKEDIIPFDSEDI
jgi:hypothetical protein